MPGANRAESISLQPAEKARVAEDKSHQAQQRGDRTEESQIDAQALDG